jgi:hypothetical protein
VPPQPLADIAAGINSIVAELKAKREGGVGVAQGAQARGKEWLRLNAEVKELCESISRRLAKSCDGTYKMLFNR